MRLHIMRKHTPQLLLPAPILPLALHNMEAGAMAEGAAVDEGAALGDKISE